MKKLLFACVAIVGFCTLGQVAGAHPYERGDYYHGRGYSGRHFAYHHYHGGYGYYPYYGPRRVFIDSFYYAPPPVYYCPPPRPAYYEGRIAPERGYEAPERSYDYSK